MKTLLEFESKIFIIGVNPYVLLPVPVLKNIFKQSGKEKGPIPVKGKLDGHLYKQTLVKYAGKWRLYLNTPMRKAAKKDVGDVIHVTVEFDPAERKIEMRPELKSALAKDMKAFAVFSKLPPSRQKEIVRYITHLKSDEAVKKNVARAVRFLNGKDRFVGRDKP